MWKNDLALALYYRLIEGKLHPFEEWLYIFYLGEEAPELQNKYLDLQEGKK